MTVKPKKQDGGTETEFQEGKLCEVGIHFRVLEEKAKHIFKAVAELGKAGIYFDTGGCYNGEHFYYDWEFDWSLEGGVEVTFRKFR
jgi:hypothetical protein